MTQTSPLQSQSITPAPTLIEFFQARPDLGAILPQVFGGTIQLSPVLIMAFPPAGTIASSEAQISQPAAREEPFLGMTAFSLSFLTRNLLTCWTTFFAYDFMISLQINYKKGFEMSQMIISHHFYRRLLILDKIKLLESFMKNQVEYLKFAIIKPQQMQNQNNEIEEQFEMPPIDFELDFEPLQNTSLVVEQTKLIFPKLDLIIDMGGVRQLSNPNNQYTTFKIVPANMKELEPIGKGAAGTVRRAIYKCDGIEMVVAIKEIMASQKQKRNQLLNDLRTFLTGSMCPQLVKFYGCYYHAGLVKQVIEYMNLGSLRNIINLVVKKKLFIEQNDLREIIRSILKGLYHIHKIKHQIHRDIKPQNILMNDKGEIKISDFGVAKYIENTLGAANTFVNIGVYMSPQRIGMSNKYNYKCDVWGVGLILYELATGNGIPYTINEGETLFVLMSKIIQSEPPNLDNTKRSDKLKNFIHACLHRDQDIRFSVEQLLAHPWIADCVENSNLVNLMAQVKQLL